MKDIVARSSTFFTLIRLYVFERLIAMTDRRVTILLLFEETRTNERTNECGNKSALPELIIEYFTDRSSVTIVFKKMDSTRMKTSGLLQDDIERN